MSARQGVARAARFLGIGMVAACLAGAAPVVYHFDASAEGWQVYDYNGGISGGGNVFLPVAWEATGGAKDSGYVWADDSKWRIDTPEIPHQIFAYVIYWTWPGCGGGTLDLREAEVSMYLRGEALDLKGGKCLFWVFNSGNGTRWEYTGTPLEVSVGAWGEPQRIVLRNDESLWQRTWSRHPDKPASLDFVLSHGDSYGLAFAGFSAEVTGKLALDELTLDLAAPPPAPATPAQTGAAGDGKQVPP
jgi:hypothetical protein